MATRKKKTSRRSAPRSADLAGSFAASGQKIWLAGLGAYERARKDGPKMFDLLVSQGKALRGQAAAAADQALKNVRAQAESASAQASGKWDKLEQVFEDRVARTLSKLGVYTQKDVQQLAARVDELALAVNKLLKTTEGKRVPAKTAARAGTKPQAKLRTKPPAKRAGKSAQKAAKKPARSKAEKPAQAT